MSAQIIKLKPIFKGTAKPPATAPRFYCTRCNDDRFHITADKFDIICASCGGIIINLEAVKR